jgi:molybdopterin-guanine dinucleotide biosynthesis protein B
VSTPVQAVPTISVVGKGDSGKTTYLEKLIRELASRGYRVATVKHHVHDYEIDVPGKDSWRHGRAGAVATMVSSASKFSLIRSTQHEMTLEEIASIAADSGCDILLTEGFKREGVNRIEVSRMARSDELVCEPAELLALVTDNASLVFKGLPTFGLDDAIGVSDLIESLFFAEGAAGEAPCSNSPRRCAPAELRAEPPRTPLTEGGDSDGQ